MIITKSKLPKLNIINENVVSSASKGMTIGGIIGFLISLYTDMNHTALTSVGAIIGAGLGGYLSYLNTNLTEKAKSSAWNNQNKNLMINIQSNIDSYIDRLTPKNKQKLMNDLNSISRKIKNNPELLEFIQTTIELLKHHK